MTKHLLIAGAAALAFTGSAVAKPGNGKGHDKHQGHSQPLGGQYGYGLGGCPPGLAKKSPACVPPGQAKKRFAVGQRLPYDYKNVLGYNALPYDLRSQYGQQLDPYGRYYYDDSYLYRVDPKTMVVQQVLNAILRP